MSDDMGEVPLAEWELVEGEAWEEEVKAEPAPALEPTIKRETSDSRRQQLQQQKPICVRSAKWRAVWAARVGIGPKQEKPKKANRRVKIQSRMQQQRQELESCAPCAAAGVATDGMGTVPANKTDQAIFLEPLPKLPPKPRVGKDIEKNARRMATWQRERGEVGLAREERKRVAANYKCMSKKQRFEFIAAAPVTAPSGAYCTRGDFATTREYTHYLHEHLRIGMRVRAMEGDRRGALGTFHNGPVLPRRLSALSGPHSKSVLYGVFAWARRAQNVGYRPGQIVVARCRTRAAWSNLGKTAAGGFAGTALGKTALGKTALWTPT